MWFQRDFRGVLKPFDFRGVSKGSETYIFFNERRLPKRPYNLF